MLPFACLPVCLAVRATLPSCRARLVLVRAIRPAARSTPHRHSPLFIKSPTFYFDFPSIAPPPAVDSRHRLPASPSPTASPRRWQPLSDSGHRLFASLARVGSLHNAACLGLPSAPLRGCRQSASLLSVAPPRRGPYCWPPPPLPPPPPSRRLQQATVAVMAARRRLALGAGLLLAAVADAQVFQINSVGASYPSPTFIAPQRGNGSLAHH